MRIYVLGTGSSGNSLLVEADGTRLLVEAGIGPKNAAARMRMLGGDLLRVDGIVVTHHHDDHAGQLEPLAKALGAPRVDGSAAGGTSRSSTGSSVAPIVQHHDGVGAERVRHRFAVRRYRAGESFEVGALRVRSVPVVHDAPHVALAIQSKTHTFGFVTDVGTVTGPLVDLLGTCNTVMMESNFCPQLLELGPYPRSLRRRIAGHLGHLSNGQAAALAGTIARHAVSKIFLCHLSQVNNEPARALATVRDRAQGAHVEVLPHGRARVIDLAPAPRRAMEQLRLF